MALLLLSRYGAHDFVPDHCNTLPVNALPSIRDEGPWIVACRKRFGYSTDALHAAAGTSS